MIVIPYAPASDPGNATVRTTRGAPRPRASTATSPLAVTDPLVTDANAHRPSAVPTKAVGCPATGAVTGLGAVS